MSAARALAAARVIPVTLNHIRSGQARKRDLYSPRITHDCLCGRRSRSACASPVRGSNRLPSERRAVRAHLPPHVDVLPPAPVGGPVRVLGLRRSGPGAPAPLRALSVRQAAVRQPNRPVPDARHRPRGRAGRGRRRKATPRRQAPAAPVRRALPSQPRARPGRHLGGRTRGEPRVRGLAPAGARTGSPPRQPWLHPVLAAQGRPALRLRARLPRGGQPRAPPPVHRPRHRPPRRAVDSARPAHGLAGRGAGGPAVAARAREARPGRDQRGLPPDRRHRQGRLRLLQRGRGLPAGRSLPRRDPCGGRPLPQRQLALHRLPHQQHGGEASACSSRPTTAASGPATRPR